jgi:hypothetical protein
VALRGEPPRGNMMVFASDRKNKALEVLWRVLRRTSASVSHFTVLCR